MAAPKKGREPEMIVFDSKKPHHKRWQYNKSTGDSTYGSGRVSKYLERKRCLEAEGLDFKATCREIRALVETGLEGKERERSDEERIIALGGKARKRPKMAYPDYMNMLKNKKKKQQQANASTSSQTELVRDNKTKKNTKSKAVKNTGWWKDRLTSLEPSVGSFKEGVLRLSARDVRNFKTKH